MDSLILMKSSYFGTAFPEKKKKIERKMSKENKKNRFKLNNLILYFFFKLILFVCLCYIRTEKIFKYIKF